MVKEIVKIVFMPNQMPSWSKGKDFDSAEINDDDSVSVHHKINGVDTYTRFFSHAILGVSSQEVKA